GTTTIPWTGGHIYVNDVSLNLTGGISDIPTDTATVNELVISHATGLRTVALLASQVINPAALVYTGATVGGYTICYLHPLPNGKYWISGVFNS
ncbi:MAG: hypothetical protein Q7U44_10315, partial [Desulfuromonadales bacterium]|nr:hypothetical protein [Desulfuromonadales bacterium]